MESCAKKLTLRASDEGIALVVILIVMVLMSVTVLAFFTSVTTELTSSKSQANNAAARQLADSGIQVAVAQIVDATKGYKVPGDPDSGRIAWASQPGMIRTYDDKGKPFKYFKLYSSDEMVLDQEGIAAFDPKLETTAWKGKAALYTDLNEPALVPDVEGVIDIGTTSFSAKYPILDPMAMASGVEGFSIDGVTSIGPKYDPIAGGNLAPMPAKWLYILSDGTLTAPSVGSGTAVTVTGATDDNPIVGRVAFWTDDETAKINLNTASEGVSWDTPRANTAQERRYGTSQPFQKEYQRYPGHPATTAISPVFFPGIDLTLDAHKDKREQLYYEVAPRIVGGGSQGGTVTWNFNDIKSGWDSSKVLRVDADRLYSSVDELLLKPDRSENPLITKEVLERAKFFITANSRAPEINLFNQPRLSMWPVYKADGIKYSERTSIFDRMIAFCSTIGEGGNAKRYYFQRERSDDKAHDFSNIARNQELYRYLKRLTSEEIPGFSGNYAAKYADGERDQILSEMVDYIRSTNQFDDTLGGGDAPIGGAPTYWVWSKNENSKNVRENLPQYTKPRYVENNTKGVYWPGHGQVTPLEIKDGSDTKGFGRIFTISEVGLAFICNIDPEVMRDEAEFRPEAPAITDAPGRMKLRDPVTGADETGKTNAAYWYKKGEFGAVNPEGETMDEQGTLLAGKHRVIQVAFFLEPFCPAMGDGALRGSLHLHIRGLDQLKVKNALGEMQSLGLPAFGEIAVIPDKDIDGTIVSTKVGSTWALVGSNRTLPIGGTESPRLFARWVTDPFYGVRVAVQVPADKTFQFIGNDQNDSLPIQVQLRQGLGGTGQVAPANPGSKVVQTINLRFPSGTFPLPELVAGGTAARDFDKEESFEAKWASARCNWWNWFRMPTKGQNSRLDARDPGNSGDTTTLLSCDPGYATSLPSRDLPASWKIEAGIQGAGALFRVDLFDYDGTRLSTPRKRDVVRTLVPRYNDARLIAGLSVVGDERFVPHPEYHTGEKFAHSFMEGSGEVYGGKWMGTLYPDIGVAELNVHRLPDTPIPSSWLPANALFRGDWDNGPGWERDGAYINKPDDGSVGYNQGTSTSSSESSKVPYFSIRREQSGTAGVIPGPTYFSPNRKVASPVMFGSLSTGVKREIPFQTLLFRPDTTFSFPYKHPGGESPKDHLLLDLFSMPVVEPYAISEPFSTAGKINMNYQIVPFDYLKRSTGIRAVLKNENIMAIPNSAKGNYKWTTGLAANTPSSSGQFRHKINLDETIKGFEERFNSKDIFRSASEICDIHLVPDGLSTYTAMKNGTFWPDYQLTGDNTRERPYANIYPRLTTKSNTFMVHVRAQSLVKRPGTPSNQWVEGRDQVMGEFRGASIIERYVDVNEQGIPDFATDDEAVLDDYYRFRVVSTKRFAP